MHEDGGLHGNVLGQARAWEGGLPGNALPSGSGASVKVIENGIMLSNDLFGFFLFFFSSSSSSFMTFFEGGSCPQGLYHALATGQLRLISSHLYAHVYRLLQLAEPMAPAYVQQVCRFVHCALRSQAAKVNVARRWLIKLLTSHGIEFQRQVVITTTDGTLCHKLRP